LGFAGAGQRVDVLFHYGQGNTDSHVTATGNVAVGTDHNGFRPGHHDFNPPRRRDYHGNTLGGAGGGGALGAGVYQNATSTLIQDAEILALDNESTPSELGSPLGDKEMVRVTLAVSPRQAEIIRVASGHGELSLTLRSPDDGGRVILEDPITLANIMSVDHSVHVMEIYRGQSRSQLSFGSKHSIKKRNFDDPHIVESTNVAKQSQSSLSLASAADDASDSSREKTETRQ
jgi:hypothetical protein